MKHEHEFKHYATCYCGETNPNYFDGETYDHDRDVERLTGQWHRVYECMSDGQPRTLRQIATATGDPEASVSARLRDLRKARFGAHKVHREYIDKGIHTYRLEAAS